MARSVVAMAWLCLTAACGAAPQPNASPVGPAATPAREAAPETSGVSVVVDAASRARYEPATVSATRSTLRITVTNGTSAPLDVSSFRAQLSVTKDGVAFPCPEAGGTPHAREVSELAPRAAFTFERRLDCALPLVGKYRVKVAVAFGRAGFWAEPRDVKVVSLDVSAPADAEPRALASVPGLFGALGASSIMPGTASAGGAKGRIVVSIVNASAREVSVPPMRLGLRVYRGKGPIPCEDEPTLLTTPPRLGPGTSHVEPVEVSCIGLGTSGRYELRGRLILGSGKVETEEEIGRLAVEVSVDPTRLTPGL